MSDATTPPAAPHGIDDVKQSSVDPKALIRARALTLGFDAVGFCRAELGAQARQRLAQFLAAGQHGDMGWLAARAHARSDPRQLWPEARSVIALGLSYAPDDDPLSSLARGDRARSRSMPATATITTWSRGCSSISRSSSSRASVPQ